MTLLLFSSITALAQRKFSFPNEYGKESMENTQWTINAELELLKKEPFIAISLGENCFPALHLREHGIRIRSFPFDWDITPFPALYTVLKHDFDGFIDLTNLAVNKKENTVFNKKYKLKLNHDFDIKDWYDGPKGLTPRNEQSMAKYQKVLAYYYRRIARFYGVFDLKVPIYLFRRVITSEQAKQLNNLLQSKFPNSNFKLICIQDEQWNPTSAWKKMPSNIVYYRLSKPIAYTYGQKKPSVTRIFRELGLLK